jgi:hypothetical protein
MDPLRADPASPPPEVNPYAPPRAAVEALAGPLRHAPGRALVWMYAAAFGVRTAINGSYALGWRPSTSLVSAASVAVGVAHTGIVLAWIFLAWRGIPRSHRGTMSPWRAVYSLFMPVYDAYFVVAMNVALCDTLNGILESARDGAGRNLSLRRAPRTLAIVASVVWLSMFPAGLIVRFTNPRGLYAAWLLVTATGPMSGALWFAYMLLCDRAREVVAQLGADASALGAPRLPRIQRKKGPHPVAAIVLPLVAIIMLLASWQVLQPAARGTGP